MSAEGHDDEWPVWAREPIALAAPDQGWAAAAAVEIAALRTVLDGAVIHHIGSTSIPELPAKPILDLMAASDGLVKGAGIAAALEAGLRPVDAALANLGYQQVPPELDARPWRRFYVKPRGSRRYAHLQLVSPLHPRWREALLFRDFLCTHESERAAYAALKQRLANRYEHDREAYSAGKSNYVAMIIARARS